MALHTARHRTIRAGLVVAATLFLLAPLLAVAILLAQAQDESLRAAEQRFAERAQVSASLIQSVFSALGASSGEDLEKHFGGTGPDVIRRLSKHLRESHVHYLAVVDARGRTLAVAGRPPREILLARAAQNGPVLSDVFDDGSGRVIEYAIPFGPPGQRRALVQGVPLKLLTAFFGDYLARFSTPAGVGVALTDGNGVAFTRNGQISLGSPPPHRVTTRAAVPGTNWSLRLEDDRDRVLDGLNRLRWLPWLLLGGLALAALTGAVLYARILTAVRRHRQANAALQESRDQIGNLVDALEEGVLLHHADGRTELLNASASELLGAPVGPLADEAVVWEMVDEAGEPLAEVDTPVKLALTTGTPQTKVVGLERGDGRRQWLTVRARPLVRHGEPDPHAVVASFTDVTDQRELELHLIDLAERDALTGLWNRRRFEGDLARQLARCRRYGERAALLLLDLDNFKQINDTLGHLAGDEVLRAFADALHQRLRAVDAAARIGGDEFAILLLDVDEAQAREIASDVMGLLSSFAHEHLHGAIDLSFSAGIALLDQVTGSAPEALAAADEALYADKRRTDAIAGPMATGDAAEPIAERPADADREERQFASLQVLLTAVQARDSYTASHSRQVVTLARAVARRLDVDAAQMSEIESAALLHDIGKIAMPDAILRKRAPLTPHEQLLMRQHPVVGAQIVSTIPDLRHLAPAIRAEHERWDGRGYPDGLAASAIPLASRIAFVCDAYHAMTSDRPYRAALSHTEATREIARESGRQFCPDASRALLEVLAATTEQAPAPAPAPKTVVGSVSS